MKYLYGIAAAIVLLSGIVLSLYFGIQPRTLPKITPSFFTNEQGMADAIIKRMNQELLAYDTLFLGAEPGRTEHLNLWLSFLEKLQSDSVRKYDFVLIDSEYAASLTSQEQEKISNLPRISLKASFEDVVREIQKRKAEKVRLAIIAPNIYTTRVIHQSPVSRIQRELKIKSASFSAVFMPMSPEEEKAMLFPCSTDDSDRLGTGALGCAVTQKYRIVRRKLVSKLDFIGLMDLTGEDDYLVFFRRSPVQKP